MNYKKQVNPIMRSDEWQQLTSSERFLLRILMDFSSDDGVFYGSQDTLAHVTGYTKFWIRKLLKGLVSKGMLELLERREGTTNRYKVLTEFTGILSEPGNSVNEPGNSVNEPDPQSFPDHQTTRPAAEASGDHPGFLEKPQTKTDAAGGEDTEDDLANTGEELADELFGAKKQGLLRAVMEPRPDVVQIETRPPQELPELRTCHGCERDVRIGAMLGDKCLECTAGVKR